MAHLLNVDQHKDFIKKSNEQKDTFEYFATEHLRVSGGFWGVSSMDMMGCLGEMKKDEIVDWVLKCQHADGGFGGNIGHDPHMLYTLSSVQVLVLFESLDKLDVDKVAKFVVSLQQSNGSFAGDQYGEIDTRFSYCALNCLALLGRLDAANIPGAVDFITSCMNFDGGFGCVPGAETHGGQVFCCVGALAIAGALDRIDHDLLGWWLAERQLPSGGLNGRPEKLADVCYSWWNVSALSILDRLHWIDVPKLTEFILQCQDTDVGGIADRPGDMSDIFHTFFGLAGLSLMSQFGLKEVDPVYAIPVYIVERLKLPNSLKYLRSR